MPNDSNNDNVNRKEENIEISTEIVQDLVKEIIALEQDNLYVNRANLKEQIVTLIKTKVR